MRPRLNYAKVAPGVYNAMDALDQYLQTCGLEAGHFGEKELCDLTLALAAINAWNRLSIAARLVPGNYRPATTAG